MKRQPCRNQLEDTVAAGGGGVELAAVANQSAARLVATSAAAASAHVGTAEGDRGEGARALLLGGLELTRGLRGEESLVGRGEGETASSGGGERRDSRTPKR